MTKTFACYRSDCGHMIAMTPEVEAQFRRTHAFFKCPAGHDQHFAQETKEEATIRRLRAQIVDLEGTIDYYREVVEEKESKLRSLRARLGWRNHWLIQDGHVREVAA